jgi:DNA-binding MarR family transcriptional regulator
MARTRTAATPLAAERDGLVDAIAQTSFATTAVLTRAAAEHDLSLTQLRVLAVLRGRRLRMSTLADHLGLERSTLSGLIDRAQRRGLVQRSPSPDDRRVVEVALTRAGVALAARVTGDVSRELAPLTDALARGERRQLRHLLERMLGPPSASLRPPASR